MVTYNLHLFFQLFLGPKSPGATHLTQTITDRSVIPAFNTSALLDGYFKFLAGYSVGKLTFLFGRRNRSLRHLTDVAFYLTDVAFHLLQVFSCSICPEEYT